VITISKNRSILIKEGNNEENERNLEYTNLGYIEFADNFLARLKGLMLNENLDHILIIKPMQKTNRYFSAIHTFFMKIQIEILFLNDKKEIIEIANLKPWKVYVPKKGATYILELKKGSIKKYGINIGEKLDFICELR
jgi:uncharacterized protein